MDWIHLKADEYAHMKHMKIPLQLEKVPWEIEHSDASPALSPGETSRGFLCCSLDGMSKVQVLA